MKRTEFCRCERHIARHAAATLERWKAEGEANSARRTFPGMVAALTGMGFQEYAITMNVYPKRVDKVIEKATKLGATSQGPVMDMFWGDRCGTVVDPDGYSWMVGTHKAEPSAKEMKKGMEEMMKQQPAGAAAAD